MNLPEVLSKKEEYRVFFVILDHHLLVLGSILTDEVQPVLVEVALVDISLVQNHLSQFKFKLAVSTLKELIDMIV